MKEQEPPSTGSLPSPPPARTTSEAPRGHPSGPRCPWASWVLLLLALVLFVFGWVYLLEPALSISSIQSIAVAIGLHLPTPPDEPANAFYGWIGFTFAYMMGAAACSFLAAWSSTEARAAYLNILLLLKGTSSLTGLALFLSQPHYAFYLATFLTDGLIFLGVVIIRTHLHARHPLERVSTLAV